MLSVGTWITNVGQFSRNQHRNRLQVLMTNKNLPKIDGRSRSKVARKKCSRTWKKCSKIKEPCMWFFCIYAALCVCVAWMKNGFIQGHTFTWSSDFTNVYLVHTNALEAMLKLNKKTALRFGVLFRRLEFAWNDNFVPFPNLPPYLSGNANSTKSAHCWYDLIFYFYWYLLASHQID